MEKEEGGEGEEKEEGEEGQEEPAKKNKRMELKSQGTYNTAVGDFASSINSEVPWIEEGAVVQKNHLLMQVLTSKWKRRKPLRNIGRTNLYYQLLFFHPKCYQIHSLTRTGGQIYGQNICFLP